MIMHPIGSVKIDVPVETATRLWRDGELDCRLSRISPVHLRRRPASTKTEINTLSDTRRYKDDDRNGGQELQENIRTIAYDNKVIRYRLQKSFLSVDPTTTGTINDSNQEMISSNNSNSRTIMNDATYLVVEIEIDLLKRHSLLNYLKAKMFAKGFQQKVQEVLEQFKEYAEEDYYIERLEKKQRLLNNFLYKKKPAAASAASSFWNHNFVNDSSSSLHSSITSLPKEGERLETIVEDEE